MSDTIFVKQPRKDKYTVLDNTCIKDSRLSWKAKGVHTYLMSLPDDWKIYLSEVVKHSAEGNCPSFMYFYFWYNHRLMVFRCIFSTYRKKI